MRSYPNCKVNLGLQVLRRRPDGYHDIASIMLPVGALCDVLDIDRLPEGADTRFSQVGSPLDCSTNDNLCMRAYQLMHDRYPDRVGPVEITLDKRIPFGAGLGGGSSDATATIIMLNRMFDLGLSNRELSSMVARIGADCPFFVYNRPAYITGIGEVVEPLDLDLDAMGYTIRVSKPDVAVSTREAYAGVTPHEDRYDLRQAVCMPLERWRDFIVNDFEESIIANHPEIGRLKDEYYRQGAVYASMSGSGSAVFAIFPKT